MQTKELVKWAMHAEKEREKSWIPNGNRYSLTMREAVNRVAPKDVTSIESDIVSCWLYTSWNEVQDWYNELFPDEPFQW